jgi:hypothetical protein
MTSISRWDLSMPEAPVDSNYMTGDDSKNELDFDDVDTDHDIDKFKLDDHDDPDLKEWFAGIKQNPLRCARIVICLLHSSDQCREGFREFVQDGNDRKWFSLKDESGKCCSVQVPELQPLRDVKTR